MSAEQTKGGAEPGEFDAWTLSAALNYTQHTGSLASTTLLIERCHIEKGQRSSFMVGPEGEVLCQMNSEAGVEVVDVPVGVIASRFHSRPYSEMGWKFRRPEVYQVYF